MPNDDDEKINPADPTKPETGGKDPKPKAGKKKKEPKLTDKDLKRVETILKTELAKRKNSPFRQNHEAKWTAVDQQIALEAPVFESEGQDDDWLNAFELGNLAVASEVMTSDLMRVVFPNARNWFEAHVEPPTDLDVETGENVRLEKGLQRQVDGRLRAMMTQQHIDFGLRDRVELSIKEALHHGGFVAEVEEDTLSMYLTGDRVKDITSPVWKPHSMWNCYPDPSPSLVGSNMFYSGSMFIRSYMPLHALVELCELEGDGWFKDALKKIPKNEHTVNDNSTKDIELDTYWGDIVIPKSSGEGAVSVDDLFYPNYKAVLANGKLVYLNANKTPYAPIVYKGYERMDVRDPYAHSPIIKQSPMQGITSILANEYVNSVQLNVRPPIVYDGNDPEFIENGGPTIAPGSKTATKGSSTFTQLKIGDPAMALAGVRFGMETMKSALGRPGIEVGSRATKAEVDTKQADSEAGPFGFAIKLDDALRTFLYMQHALNLANKTFDFSFYDPDVDSPDFLRTTRKDLPATVHFEVVGTKGVLGENKRMAAFSNVSSFMLGHPALAAKIDLDETMKQMYQDAGVKSPERFIKTTDGVPPEMKDQLQKASQLIAQLQQQLKEEQAETALKTKRMMLDHDTKMTKIQTQHSTDVAELHLKADQLALDHRVMTGDQAHKLKMAELDAAISKFEHTVKLTVAKHENAPPIEPPEAGAMGVASE
jgi:hypothetical protein